MKSQSLLNSWNSRRIYSLPTWRGMLPLLLTGHAGYVSFTQGSPAHQALVVLMSVFTVLHLLESSTELRELRLRPDPDALIFAGIPTRIRLLPGQGSALEREEIELNFAEPGVYSLPKTRVTRMARSGLFRFWRFFHFPQKVFVLPRPVDHGIALELPLALEPEDPDSLLPVRDPRLLPRRDAKIFRKTGKSVLRTRSFSGSDPRMGLDWARLEALDERSRYEQCSHWVQQIESRREFFSAGIEVSAPFFELRKVRDAIDWRRFREALALASSADAASSEERSLR